MKRLFLLFIILGLLLVAYLGSAPILRGIGQYLVYETPLQQADAILVLSGGAYSRVPEAADLYKRGYARRIILTSEVKPDGYDYLLTRGIRLPTSLDLSLEILQRLGVPRKAVDIVPGEADSTLTELCSLKAFLKQKPLRSIIFVTDPWHSKRVSKIMGLVVNGNIQAFSKPTQYNQFRPEDWWKQWVYVKQLLFEYQKVLNYWRIAAMTRVHSAIRSLPWVGPWLSGEGYPCPARMGR